MMGEGYNIWQKYADMDLKAHFEFDKFKVVFLFQVKCWNQENESKNKSL